MTAPADTRPLRKQAIDRLAGLGYSAEFAEMIVDTVFEDLAVPDRDMLEAGRAELDLAMGKGDPRGAAYRRDLARVVWCAMLDRGR